MKNKNLTLFGVSALFILLLVSFVSATITISDVPQLSKTGDSFSITVETDEVETIDFSVDSISYSGKTITFTSTSESFNNESKSITIDYNIPSGFEFELGEDYSTILTATGSVSDEATQSIEFEDPDYCVLGEQGSWLRLDVEDQEKDNPDEWEWKPLDEIEISVEIENKYDEDLEGTIEYGLYDTQENDWVFEEDMDFDVNDDDEEDYTLEFKIDPTDLNDDTDDGDYIFYVKVYDEEEADEETQCRQYSHDVEVKRNKDEVLLKESEIQVTPENPGCGSEVEVVAEIYNVGTRDQEDIVVTLYNSELKVNLEKDLGDIDVGESNDIRFSFTLPTNVEAKSYKFQISIYDEDNDIYKLEDHDGDDYDAEFTFVIKLEEGSCNVAPKATISHSLESEAKAGEELIVKAIVTNTGLDTATFTLSASDYSEWAELSEITPTILALNKGESKEVLVKLLVNDDTEGTKVFNIEATSGDQGIKQPVSVVIEDSGFNFGFTGFAVSGNNWYLWGIGALNVILIIIIILVALRIARS